MPAIYWCFTCICYFILHFWTKCSHWITSINVLLGYACLPGSSGQWYKWPDWHFMERYWCPKRYFTCQSNNYLTFAATRIDRKVRFLGERFEVYIIKRMDRAAEKWMRRRGGGGGGQYPPRLLRNRLILVYVVYNDWQCSFSNKGSFQFTPAQMGGLVTGAILGALIAVSLVIWCNRQIRIRMEKKGLVSG